MTERLIPKGFIEFSTNDDGLILICPSGFPIKAIQKINACARETTVFFNDGKFIDSSNSYAELRQRLFDAYE
jgi:hypothetical protein